MSKYTRLKKEYEDLNSKYAKLFATNQELQYAYEQIKSLYQEKEKQDQEIRNLHQTTRKLKHDMKNHFMVLSSLLASENYEKAKEYSTEVIARLSSMNTYVETGNVLLNHIMNEKFRLARGNHIQVKAEIENLAFAKMNSMDFSAMLTNLLDNAMEACIGEKEKDRELQLIITKRQGYEAICVKNRITRSVLEENPKLHSTKSTEEGEHGFGVNRIKEITERYHGIYDIYEENNYFCFSVFIPE